MLNSNLPQERSTSLDWVAWLTVGGLTGLLCWSYWPVFVEMANKWMSDPQYSHAILVPIFSAYLVWQRFRPAELVETRPCWWGLLLLAFGIGLRLAGARYYVDFLEAISLLFVIAGGTLLILGQRGFGQTWPAIAFLVFMIPLPFRIETGLSLPLQRLATLGSTFVLQTLGSPAFPEGNVIVINDARIGVIEACSGLGMFLMFVAVSVAFAFVVARPLWQKIILVLSAVPIAVAVNLLRIVITSLLHEKIGSPRFDEIAHDLAGWFMMPLALILLGLELRFLDRLFVETLVGNSSWLKSAVMRDPSTLRRERRLRATQTTR